MPVHIITKEDKERAETPPSPRERTRGASRGRRQSRSRSPGRRGGSGGRGGRGAKRGSGKRDRSRDSKSRSRSRSRSMDRSRWSRSRSRSSAGSKRASSQASTASTASAESSENGEPAKKKGKNPVEIEHDEATLRRREKQIEYGKNTIAYEEYSKIPKSERTMGMPTTPKKQFKYSRRQWDGLIKHWKLGIHKYGGDAKELSNDENRDTSNREADASSADGDDDDDDEEAEFQRHLSWADEVELEQASCPQEKEVWEAAAAECEPSSSSQHQVEVCTDGSSGQEGTT